MRASILVLALCALTATAAPAQQPGPGASLSANVLEQDIRDIKGPVEIPAPPSSPPWIPFAAGALVLAGVGFVVLLFAMRTTKQTPIEAARASLDFARLLIPEGLCREVAYRVSETVRQFIEQRLGLPASRETTEEFLRRLGDRASVRGDERRDAFAAFLEACDLAKFSGWQLDRDRMVALVERCSNLVETIEKEQRAP